LKISEKISWYTSRHFMFIHEVSWEKTFFCGLYKKTNFDAVTLLFTWPFFVFFTCVIENVFSPQNFMGEHKLFRCTLKIFCLIFLTF
jgi:hypothetical protein